MVKGWGLADMGRQEESGHLNTCLTFLESAGALCGSRAVFPAGMLRICRWTLEGSVTASCFQEPFQLPLWAVSCKGQYGHQGEALGQTLLSAFLALHTKAPI